MSPLAYVGNYVVCKNMALIPHPQLITLVEKIGCTKTSLAVGRLAVLSVMAGAFIALGGILSVFVGFGVPGIADANPGIQKLLSGLMFPIGLFLIVLFGGELFTGNNAVLMPGCIKGHFSTLTVVRHWALVWGFNFVGALAFTYLFVYMSGLTANEPYHTAVIDIAQAKASLPWEVSFVKGIAANWCVCLAVWLCLMVDSLPSKMLACWIPVGAFVVLGYEHSIANMFFIPAGMLEGADVDVAGLFNNLVPVTLGNIAGGALLVGTLFHGLHGRGEKQ